MNKNHLLIRCDASSSIGVGHVMRCLAIAQSWHAIGGQVTFASAMMPGTLIQRIKHDGFSLEVLPILESEIGSTKDLMELCRVSKKINAAAIVTDGYRFDDPFQNKVDQLGVATLLIDDYGQLNQYGCDLVLNQNLGATQTLYGNPSPKTQLLLGTKYALLRQEFLQLGTAARDRSGIPNRILVTFGGSDPEDATSTVVAAMKTMAPPGLANAEFKIVLGAAYSHCSHLVEVISDDPRFELLQDVQNMAPLYHWADLAICAGGSSNWEMSYFGLPRLVIPIAKNQEPGTVAMETAGACATCELTPQQIQPCLYDLILSPSVRSRMIEASTGMVDGLGASRVTQALLKRIKDRF